MIDPALLDVTCPLCNAGPLEPCTTGGRYMESTVHYPRRIRAGVPLEEEPEPKTPRQPKAPKTPKPRKVRSTQPRQPVTHCRRGHEYNEANTYRHANGNKKCRPCDVDAKRKRRESRGTAPRGRATHCKRDHEYTPENTDTSSGSRRCRTCKRERDRISAAKRRAEA